MRSQAQDLVVSTFQEIGPFNEGNTCYDFPWGHNVFAGREIQKHHKPTQLRQLSVILLSWASSGTSSSVSATEGYKVYWENGAQIIPPHDAKMAALIEENLKPWESLADVEGVLKHPLCEDPKAYDS